MGPQEGTFYYQVYDSSDHPPSQHYPVCVGKVLHSRYNKHPTQQNVQLIVTVICLIATPCKAGVVWTDKD